MLHIVLHCDVCLRQRTDVRGWWVVIESAEIKTLVPLRMVRLILARELAEDEITRGDAVKACCGIECLTKAIHVFTDSVLRERAPSPNKEGI